MYLKYYPLHLMQRLLVAGLRTKIEFAFSRFCSVYSAAAIFISVSEEIQVVIFNVQPMFVRLRKNIFFIRLDLIIIFSQRYLNLKLHEIENIRSRQEAIFF